MAKLAKHQNSAAILDDENPEWTAEDFSKARPASEVLPEIFPKAVADAMLKRGRPHKEVTKAPVNIRLSPDVVDAFRATGKGWQTRVDEALKDWLKSHKPASSH
ncbi:MAG: BrnA antitoxin family protein [Gallionellaceae bacterium]|nr:BrnA antitoxin family protein [Gallionellaceae bacterium]